MLNESVHLPLERLCKLVNHHKQDDTVSPRFFPLLPVWFLGSLLVSVATGGAAYAGAKMRMDKINEKIVVGAKVIENQFNAVYDASTNDNHRLNDLQAMMMSVLNN